MKGKILLSFKGLNAVLTKEANDKIIDLLSKTVLGSKGGMRYVLQSVASRIKAYKHIRFVSMYKNETLTGTVGLCYRRIHQGDSSLPGIYLRYLAVNPQFQSDADVSKRRKQRSETVSEDSMKGRVLSFFRKPQMLDLPDYSEDDKNVLYAYVESVNLRSKNMIHQVGFQHIRSFITIAFSRFSPKLHPGVNKLDVSDRAIMTSLLKDYYKSFSFYSDEITYFKDSYYVMRSDGEIVAGLSAVPTTYDVVDVPGFWGWIFMHLFPWLPWFRRLFKPGIFRFLLFGSIYVKPGHDLDLELLMESVCASEKINTGLTWADNLSELFDILSSRLNMGALNRMLKVRPGLVYANFINMSEEDKEFFFDNPAFISGFDFT
jgi:hypothetical protein